MIDKHCSVNILCSMEAGYTPEQDTFMHMSMCEQSKNESHNFHHELQPHSIAVLCSCLQIIIPTSSCPNGQLKHGDKCCRPVLHCPTGSYVKTCKRNGNCDECLPCPSGTENPFITSSFDVKKCYKNDCPTGSFRTSKDKCECAFHDGYIETEDKMFCQKINRGCQPGQELTDQGRCETCADDHYKYWNGHGYCVKQIEIRLSKIPGNHTIPTTCLGFNDTCSHQSRKKLSSFLYQSFMSIDTNTHNHILAKMKAPASIIFIVYLFYQVSRVSGVCPEGQLEHGDKCCKPVTHCPSGSYVKTCERNGNCDKCLSCPYGTVNPFITSSFDVKNCYKSDCPKGSFRTSEDKCECAFHIGYIETEDKMSCRQINRQKIDRGCQPGLELNFRGGCETCADDHYKYWFGHGYCVKQMDCSKIRLSKIPGNHTIPATCLGFNDTCPQKSEETSLEITTNKLDKNPTNYSGNRLRLHSSYLCTLYNYRHTICLHCKNKTSKPQETKAKQQQQQQQLQENWSRKQCIWKRIGPELLN
ncbi:Hypothetical predicted protein [Octopus vulgaris]|uniref:Uncharacterized protein n=1 Tax=Octopus vulgaris TaxID=6645 RepID=A0AA36BUZ3_OCTVU|nr:Hypothetical predicted protein [Octopus vulgaris]